MDKEAIKQEAFVMVDMYVTLFHEFANKQTTVSEDTLKSLTATMYIQGSKGGSFSKPSPAQPAPQQSGPSKQYDAPVGDQGFGFCDNCNAPKVKNPKTGKTFCSAKCWV